MKAVVMHEQGPPSVLRYEDVAMPAVADHEVLLQVAACGVSYHDIVERNGAYTRGAHFPAILGYEISGPVVEVGSRVRGDRLRSAQRRARWLRRICIPCG